MTSKDLHQLQHVTRTLAERDLAALARLRAAIALIETEQQVLQGARRDGGAQGDGCLGTLATAARWQDWAMHEAARLARLRARLAREDSDLRRRAASSHARDTALAGLIETAEAEAARARRARAERNGQPPD